MGGVEDLSRRFLSEFAFLYQRQLGARRHGFSKRDYSGAEARCQNRTRKIIFLVWMWRMALVVLTLGRRDVRLGRRMLMEPAAARLGLARVMFAAFAGLNAQLDNLFTARAWRKARDRRESLRYVILIEDGVT